ncbi:MAG: LysR family transcriptional regulator [Pseudomonadales bacterium]
MALNSEDLLVILALSEEGTLEAAGRSLQRDSSSVFRAIKRIEQRLGRTLFTRSHQGFTALDDVQPLLHSARQISDQIALANQLFEREDALSGTLSITTTDLLLHQFIAPRLAQFHAQYPALTLNFDTQNKVTQLWQRNFDLALRPSSAPPEQMIGSVVMSISHRLVADHSLLKSDTLQPGTRFLLPAGEIAQHPTAKWMRDYMPEGAQVSRYNSMLQLYAAVASAQGAACLPDLGTFAALGERGIVALPGSPACFPTQVWALYHPSNRYSAKVRCFVDFLKAAAQSVSLS